MGRAGQQPRQVGRPEHLPDLAKGIPNVPLFVHDPVVSVQSAAAGTCVCLLDPRPPCP